MPDFIGELIKQVPATVAVIVVVVYFLRHLNSTEDRREKNEERREKNDERRAETIKDMARECHTFQATITARNEASAVRMQDALDRNTAALGRAGEAMDRLEEYLNSVAPRAKALSQKRP